MPILKPSATVLADAAIWVPLYLNCRLLPLLLGLCLFLRLFLIFWLLRSVLSMHVRMAQIAVRLQVVSNALLENLGLRKSAFCLAVPQQDFLD